MKKVLSLMLIIAVLLATAGSVTACGNMSAGLGNYTFTHVHFSDGVNEAFCGTVEKWYDNSTGIEVHTTEHGPMYIAEGCYTLFESGAKCPYCGE